MDISPGHREKLPRTAGTIRACLETPSGDLVASAGFYNLPDGSNPTGKFAALLRSRDHRKTWDDRTFLVCAGLNNAVGNSDLRDATWPPGDHYLAYDERNRRHLANQLVVSHDNGYTWAQLIDTGHMAQSSRLLFLGGEYLRSIRGHRAEDPGI